MTKIQKSTVCFFFLRLRSHTLRSRLTAWVPVHPYTPNQVRIGPIDAQDPFQMRTATAPELCELRLTFFVFLNLAGNLNP